MRYFLAILLLALVSVAACSPQPSGHAQRERVSQQHVAKEVVVAAAKRLSENMCMPSPSSRALGIAGCKCIALFADNQWNVTVVSYELVNGKRAYAQGGPSYVFDAKGKLIRVVGGM